MARQQLGTDPTNALDAATRAYVLANKGSGSGGGGGNGNVYIQQFNPNMQSPGEWWQTDSSGNLVTLWVETATTYATAPPTNNLNARYRAGSLGLSNGQSVSSWTPEVGAFTPTVPSGATAPTFMTGGYGGKSAVTFDGSANRLAVGYNTINQPVSLVLVMNQKRATTAEMPLNTTVEVSINTSTTGYTAYAGNTVVGGTPTTGGHLLVLGVDSGGGANMILDGNNVLTGNIGTNPINQLSIGGHPNNIWFTQMDLYELLIYSGNLLNASNASDLATLKSYVRGAYGLTVA